MISLTVGTLSLAAAVTDDATVHELWVEIDLVGLMGLGEGSEGSELCTARRRKPSRTLLAAGAEEIEFGYSGAVAIAPGSEEQAVLCEALGSADEQDADVYFDLMSRREAGPRGRDRDGPSGEVQLAQGFINLQRMLLDGRDLRSRRVSLQGRRGLGSLGTLEVSFTAIGALRAAAKQGLRRREDSAARLCRRESPEAGRARDRSPPRSRRTDSLDVIGSPPRRAPPAPPPESPPSGTNGTPATERLHEAVQESKRARRAARRGTASPVSPPPLTPPSPPSAESLHGHRRRTPKRQSPPPVPRVPPNAAASDTIVVKRGEVSDAHRSSWAHPQLGSPLHRPPLQPYEDGKARKAEVERRRAPSSGTPERAEGSGCTPLGSPAGTSPSAAKDAANKAGEAKHKYKSKWFPFF